MRPVGSGCRGSMGLAYLGPLSSPPLPFQIKVGPIRVRRGKKDAPSPCVDDVEC